MLGPNLERKRTQSCGCLKKDTAGKQNLTHGMAGKNKKSAEYAAWASTLARCYNSKNPGYKNYGGRGIAVCQEWDSFEAFYRDMGPRPIGHTLERKNTNEPYCKNNCKWATQKEQQNNRRNNRFLTYNNKTKTLAQWAEEFNIKYNTLWARLRNWSIGRALYGKEDM